MGESIDPQEELTASEVELDHWLGAVLAQTGDGREQSKTSLTKLGPYQFQSVLGEGSFGVVYHAIDSRTELAVALKVARSRVASNKRLRQRFFKETTLASKLDHPGIVKILHAGEERGSLFIAMELCRGMTLAEWLHQKRDNVPIASSIRLMRSVALAVQHGHSRDVIHRDLKPDNIMVLDGADEPILTKILDFGLACQTEETIRNTSICAIVGTPLYMAPERITWKENETTISADIYSLGAILYECLTGVAPCLADSVPEVMQKILRGRIQEPRTINLDIPEELATICMKCLALYPEDRYASVSAFIDDLDAWINGEGIKAKRLGVGKRVINWMRDSDRHREFGIGLTVINLLVLGWAIINYPLAMLFFPVQEGDIASQQMFIPVVLLIIPIHGALLWSSVRMYQRKLPRMIGLAHLISTILMAVVSIYIVCFTIDLTQFALNRFERVAALGLMSTFAEVQAILVGLLLYFGEWPKRS